MSAFLCHLILRETWFVHSRIVRFQKGFLAEAVGAFRFGVWRLGGGRLLREATVLATGKNCLIGYFLTDFVVVTGFWGTSAGTEMFTPSFSLIT